MAVKKTIAIIGATGKAGMFITKYLAGENYRILLIDKDEEELTGLINEMTAVMPSADIEAMNCAFNGCWEADIIIIDAPCTEQKETAAKIKDVATGKTIISICSKDETTASKETDVLQKALPHSKVIHLSASVKINEIKDALITCIEADVLRTGTALRQH